MQAYCVNNTNPFINMTQITTSRNAEPFILLIKMTKAYKKFLCPTYGNSISYLLTTIYMQVKVFDRF